MSVPVVSSVDSWKRKKMKVLHKLQENTEGFLSFFTLWNRSMQQIAGTPSILYLKVYFTNAGILFCILKLSDPTGNFGGGVQSYFLFLRFLVVLNFVSFLLIAGFVLIPSIVFRSAGSSLVNVTGKGTSHVL